MVYCSDIEAFTTYIIAARDIEAEDVQVNIDDGQQVDKVRFILQYETLTLLICLCLSPQLYSSHHPRLTVVIIQ